MNVVTRVSVAVAALASMAACGAPPAAGAPDAAADVRTTPDASAPADATVPSDAAAASDDGAPARDGAVANDARADAAMPVDGATPGDGGRALWRPAPGTSWQWQLSGTVDTSVDAQVYDIDLYTNAPAVIERLHALGRRVVCYFDTAYEPGRPDSGDFTAAVLGNPMEGWPGQRWVDIRSPVVRGIMLRRMDLAVAKRCDAVEPDDLDVYQNDPGFPITPADQLDFARFLARSAHERGLSVALKNDIDQVAELVGDFDFAINEECFRYDECAALSAFVSAGRAVFQVEYGAASLASTVCPRANALSFDTLIKNLDLDAWRVACR